MTLKLPEPKPYKQLYTDKWLQLRNRIENDDSLNRKSACKDLLLLIQHNTNYRTGEVAIDIQTIKDYLKCGKTTAYSCLKWFKDNAILISADEAGALLPNGIEGVKDQVNLYYGK